MAEVVLAIGAVLMPAAAPAVAAAGTATTLSTVITIGSALASIAGGISASNRLKAEAREAQIQASEQQLRGAEETRDLALEHRNLRADQDVVALANGLDIGVGSPVNIREATDREATRRMDISRKNTTSQVRMTRLRSRGLLSEAKSAFTSGLLAAGGHILDGQALTS